MGFSRQEYWSGVPLSSLSKSLGMVITTLKLKDACLFEGKLCQSHSLLKSRDFTLLRMVHIVRAIVFPVVMYGCESWTIKKAEH